MHRRKMLTIKFSAHTTNDVDNCDCRASQRRREQRIASKKESSELRTYFYRNIFTYRMEKFDKSRKQLCEHFPESRASLTW